MFHEKIAPYVHPSMDYKLHPDFRGQFRWEPDTSDAHLNGTRLKSRTTMKAASDEGSSQVPEAADAEKA